MIEGSPVDVLPELSVGDELLLYFDRYNQGYPEKPESPLETTVLDVETRELTEKDTLPGTLTKIVLSVPADDEKADEYWMEHRVEHQGDETYRSAGYLLYEDRMFSALPTSGQVGHIDRIEVLSSGE